MNRRNKLQINNADAQLNSLHSDSIILNPRLTEEFLKTRPETVFGAADDTVFDDGPDDIPDSPVNTKLTMQLPGLFRLCVKAASVVKSYLLYCALVGTIVYLLHRPSEYDFLLDEIHSLKEQNRRLQSSLEPVNMASVSQGATVTVLSPLYTYGFAGSSRTDPSAILDSTKECLALQGTAGSFRIGLKHTASIKRVGIHHPPTANQSAAVRSFRITLGDAVHSFTFRGSGYQEFVAPGTADSVKFDVLDNHGEPKYTSVYQVYVLV
ncbi:hypothetical protein PAPHI01_1712 [Pancytospora philotis]|nr:hypothetical protein PAPHI01_1712 [Pancytospora philotis]